MSAIIDVKNVCLALGEQPVHQNINLSVNAGDVLAIVGGSGAGKTLLMREMLGLQPIDSGSIQVFGADMAYPFSRKSLATKRRWGAVFQQNALFSSMTILENTAFPLREYTTLDEESIKEKARSAIMLAGLLPRVEKQYPSELSGGMQKRAAVARAIVLNPELLFLDEATAGLDPESAGALDDLVIELQKKSGMTVVMVTHDVDTLYCVPNRIAFLGEKTILCCGDIEMISNHPHPFIQHFFHGARGKKHGNNG